jgi:hypothetical protein
MPLFKRNDGMWDHDRKYTVPSGPECDVCGALHTELKKNKNGDNACHLCLRQEELGFI